MFTIARQELHEFVLVTITIILRQRINGVINKLIVFSYTSTNSMFTIDCIKTILQLRIQKQD